MKQSRDQLRAELLAEAEEVRETKEETGSPSFRNPNRLAET